MTLTQNLFQSDSIALSLGVNVSASAAQRGLGFARGIVLAWLMSQGEFGLLGVALMVANLLMPVCTAGLYEGIARYTPYHESARTLLRFAVRSLVLTVGIAAAVTAILFVPAEAVGRFLFSAGTVAMGQPETGVAPSDPGALTRAALICVFTMAPFHAVIALLKGLRMFRALSLMELTAAVLFTLLALGGAWAGFATAGSVMIAYAVSNLVSIVVFAPGLFSSISLSSDIETRADGDRRTLRSTLFTYSAWAGGTAILWHAISCYPMWHLLKVSDQETVGTFHAVRMVTQLVVIGAVMLVSIVSANAARLWEHEGRELAVAQLVTWTKATLLVLFGAAACLSVACPLIMRVLPKSFGGGVEAFDVLLLFFLLVSFVLLIAVRINLIENPRLVFVAWVVGAVVSVIACCVLLGAPLGRTGDLVASALQSTAWAGVAGIGAAALTLLGLCARENLAPTRSTLVLAVCCVSVGFGWWLSVPVLVVVSLAACFTQAIFTKKERVALLSGITRLDVR